MANVASDFEQSVVLVTAAAGLGIGQAVARRFAEGGARVVVTDIHERRTREVVKSMTEDYADREIVGYPLDAGDRDAIDHVVEQVLEKFGAIDILVNNAAVNVQRPIFDYDPADWDRVMAVNVNGPWYLARRIFPRMRERGHGVVINIGSYAADIGTAAEAPYAVSKGALNTLTRCLANEGGPYGIRANTVSTGVVEGTKFVMDHPEIREMTETIGPVGSWPDKDEIAEVVAFLASRHAAHITGEIINVSGGAYMRN